MREDRWSFSLIAHIGKSAAVFPADDLATKRKLQLELKATPLK